MFFIKEKEHQINYQNNAHACNVLLGVQKIFNLQCQMGRKIKSINYVFIILYWKQNKTIKIHNSLLGPTKSY